MRHGPSVWLVGLGLAAAALPGAEVGRHAHLVELASRARTKQAHAELANRIVGATELARWTAATAVVADAIGAIEGGLDTAAWDR